jgi:hypothetical protein
VVGFVKVDDDVHDEVGKEGSLGIGNFEGCEAEENNG